MKRDKKEKRERHYQYKTGINFRTPNPNWAPRELIWITFGSLEYKKGRMQHRKLRLHGSSAVTKQKAAPSIGSSSAKRDFEREKEAEDTIVATVLQPTMVGLRALCEQWRRRCDLESHRTSTKAQRRSWMPRRRVRGRLFVEESRRVSVGNVQSELQKMFG